MLKGRPPRNRDFLKKSLNTYQNLYVFQYFQNKVTKIRGEIGIWGQVVLTHLNPSPPPYSKLRVDAPAGNRKIPNLKLCGCGWHSGIPLQPYCKVQ